jgi:uncharacterized protein
MQFSWDADKSNENLRRRNIDFEFASHIFAGFTLDRADVRREYGEHRMVAIGVASGRVLTVVYTDRQNISGEMERRIISARRSNKKERKDYERSSSY